MMALRWTRRLFSVLIFTMAVSGYAKPVSCLDDTSSSGDPVDMVKEVENCLALTTSKNFKGITYNVTDGNNFPKKWLHATPLMPWGSPPLSLVYFMPKACSATGGKLKKCRLNLSCSTIAQQQYKGEICCDPYFKSPLCTLDDGTSKACQPLSAYYNPLLKKTQPHCVGTTDPLVDAIYNNLIQAKQYIDITTLSPFPDVRFFATIRSALIRLAASGRNVTVRILTGLPPLSYESKTYVAKQRLQQQIEAETMVRQYLESLIAEIKNIKQSQLSIYVGTMRSCSGDPSCASGRPLIDKMAWNHSKIVAVDGKYIFTGGHNQVTASYLLKDQIHDVSITFQGPGVADAHRFINELWGFVCQYNGVDPYLYTAIVYSYVNGEVGTQCQARLPWVSHSNNDDTKPAFAYTNVTLFSLGRLGSGIIDGAFKNHNQAEIGRNLLLKKAKKVIRISQQNLGNRIPGIDEYFWPTTNIGGNEIGILAQQLLNNVKIYIVVTNLDAKDAAGTVYSTGVSISKLADEIYTWVTKKNRLLPSKKRRSNAQLIQLLCNNLHLATIRFSPDANAWPDGSRFGNHAKVWIVDNLLFYVGSHNMYESNLQQFGYVVANKAITNEFITKYYDKLWYYSKRTAISGDDRPGGKVCYFTAR